MLEARHPLKPYLICAATVSQVLKYGYFIAEFRTTQKEHDNPITFLFHVTSPYILPCGFCKEHNIPLVPPHGEDRDTFHWNEHLEKRVAEAASLHLIPPVSTYTKLNHPESNRFYFLHSVNLTNSSLG